MPNQAYFPRPESDQTSWLQNYANKLPKHGPTCGITADEITLTVKELESLIYVLSTWNPALQNDAQQATAFKKALATGTGPIADYPAPTSFGNPPPVAAPGVLTRLFNQVARIKLAPAYTDAIGQSLNIIGSAQTGPDLTIVQPILTAQFSGSSVKIGWGWGGNSAFLDMLELQVDRGDGKGYVLLAFDTTPNYEDTTPLPPALAKWTYKAIYHVGDHQVGQWSAEISVTVGS
jgi:hypothetical protein